MILPTKHLSQDRALLTVGARILNLLHQPKTVSALWNEIPNDRNDKSQLTSGLSYDGFILALDLLFMIGTIDIKEELLVRKTS